MYTIYIIMIYAIYVILDKQMPDIEYSCCICKNTGIVTGLAYNCLFICSSNFFLRNQCFYIDDLDLRCGQAQKLKGFESRHFVRQ